MRDNYQVRLFIVSVVSLLFLGCANNTTAPITQKAAKRAPAVIVHGSGSETKKAGLGVAPITYVVKNGDTLHSIAWRFSLDYRNISRWNGVTNPNLIYIGQKLRLTTPVKPKRAAALKKKPTAKRAEKNGGTKTISRQKVVEKDLKWSWPANGIVQAASTALGTKGIEILGTTGMPIKAAANGAVVYSGSGLRGYGRLIILKHSEEFLSAYAHNERLRVKEGVVVKGGQVIAEMGSTDAKRVMLHFEIRRNGKAVEPLDFLPRR